MASLETLIDSAELIKARSYINAQAQLLLDAEKEALPEMFEKVFWTEIKETITRKVDEYLDIR